MGLPGVTGGGGGGGTVEGVLCVKVMTDEQMEVLRKQISVYTIICEQLVEMHEAVTAQQDSLAGMRLGNLYCDPLMTSGGHKITARQRWTATPMQLQVLESIFEQVTGTPSKQKIKEITSELANHGQISETNVYNWFQNKRARSKRKQTVSSLDNVESEFETEVNSPKEKKCKPDKILSLENEPQGVDDASFHSPENCSDFYPMDLELTKVQGNLALNGSSKSFGGLGHQISFYALDRLMGNMETSGSYNPFHTGDGFGMVG